MNFVEHKTKNKDKSSVWFYFLVDSKGTPHAKCKMCSKILKTNGGSTKGLLNHITCVHMIKLQKNDCDEPQSKILKITDFSYPKHAETFPAVISKLIALDGLPFSLFITSIELRKSLQARGFDVPKSKETIKSKFMEFYFMCKENMRHEISNIKSKGNKFSITFDEWTSTSNKRFINVIAHTNGKLFNLGLIRLKKSGTALNCINHISDKLKEFDLYLSSDVVSFTTDGASTMQKIGKLISPKQQLCFAHGLHLALLDVIYKKNTPTNHELSSDDDDDDDGLFNVFEVNLSENQVEMTDKFYVKPVIEKVRKIVKMFRKSPTKNEILQKYVKEEKGKELMLILDCSTRWNTLFDMCQRFCNLENSLKKALIDLNLQQFADEEFVLLKKVVGVLNPIKITLEALCRVDMNLCKADAALTFMLNEIKKINCDLGEELYKSLYKRIEERRTVFSTVLNFLKNPDIKSDFDNNVDIIKIKYELKQLIVRLSQNNDSIESTTQDVIEVLPNEEILEENNNSIAQKLEDAIAKCKSPQKTIKKHDNLDDQLSKELDLFISGGIRGKYLQECYKYLQTVLPTSVECERCFSTAAYVGNKIRSRLSDNTLDALIFLRNYLK